ncbi:MAG TPA: alpha/beta hydrolase [Dehalococcoidia bacterium]|nr:alpha/beta hydrolase [Dehalococcoidia bacterium]
MLRKLLYGAAALSAPGVALTIGAERVIRPRLFYHGPWHAEPPDAVGRPYEEAHIFTPDGLELQGWYFPADAAGAPTLLFCHGTSYSASDMWLTDERSSAFHDFLAGVGCNFLLFDYRGYGRNGGAATEQRTYVDAAAALAWLHQRGDIDPATVFFYGFSLGTGVAAELALREPCAGLILRAPFTSIRGMIADWYPQLRPLLAAAPWLPLTNYDTLSKMARLERPLLVMHGEADETVPESMGQRVFEAAPGPKMYVSFPDGGHSDINTDLVVPAIRQFVDAVVSGRLGDGAGAAAAR